jgi:hypothetical protein
MVPNPNSWVYDKWIEERPENRFKLLHLGNWEMNDAVHKREDVEAAFRRGDISESRAQEMLRMRWTVNRKGEKVVTREESH